MRGRGVGKRRHKSFLIERKSLRYDLVVVVVVVFISVDGNFFHWFVFPQFIVSFRIS